MLQALAAARDINLSQQIIQPGERPALFFGVPALPDHFVGRAELVDQVAAQLLAGANPALSADGLPGVGKTTLAVVLAHRRDLLAHFRDGVL
ncbi:MAG: hypothetical protein DCC57_16290 [Chloroflexi bacterium]|nr:MAG: hypothetical protein DCC57_16290 [Chloroflexota bacterium]